MSIPKTTIVPSPLPAISPEEIAKLKAEAFDNIRLAEMHQGIANQLREKIKDLSATIAQAENHQGTKTRDGNS